MTPSNPVGTLIRCPELDERRLEFLASIGLSELQIAGLTGNWLDNGTQCDKLFARMEKHGFRVSTMFLSVPDINWGDHGDIGLIPEEKRFARAELMKRQMTAASAHGVRMTLCHAGRIPNPPNREYEGILSVLRDLADHAAGAGMEFLFETGQENAEELERILRDMNRANIGINLDPANLLIYGSDEPMRFLRKLRPWIRSMHCKDARHAQAGETEGRETVLGAGETHFADLLRELRRGGFTGPLIIERELPVGPEQERDIANAVKYIQNILEDET